MTYCEMIKNMMIEQLKNKSVLDMAYEFKKTDEYKNKSMDEIVKILEREVEENDR